MTPYLGYWQRDGSRTLVRGPDGARVTYLGPIDERPRTVTSRWLRFEAATAHGTAILPVEQRLRGRDTNFRALWYRIDLSESELGELLGDAVIRLLVDALSCWPSDLFATGFPTGIGVKGGHVDCRFVADLYRLYLPNYAKRTPDGGELPQLPPPERWEYYPLDGSIPAPDIERAASGDLATQRAFIADAAMRGPTLASGEQMIIFRSETTPIPIIYADGEVFSDGFRCFKGRNGNWEIGGGDKLLGTRLLATGQLPKSPKGTGPANLIDQALMRFADRHGRLKRRPGKPVHQLGTLPVSYQTLFHAALEDAMLHLVTATREGGDDFPRRVEQTASILRAGRLPMKRVVTREIPAEYEDSRGEQLFAAFGDDPVRNLPLGPGPGAVFDERLGVLYGPDGSSLAFEGRDDDDLLTPLHLRFRCRSAGLDWPVLVNRRDERPEHAFGAQVQLLNRWQVDHEECLAAWHKEGHRGLPDSGKWDRMRQFLEDAFLSWGDGPAAGPAPQSLETFGGYYDGEWRDRRFRRLLGRPTFLPSEPTLQQAWSPYQPAADWRAVIATEDAAGVDRPREGFEKRGGDGAILHASGHLDWSDSQGCVYRINYVDFRDASVRLRMTGTAASIHTSKVWSVPLDAPPVTNGNRKNESATGRDAEAPSLSLWRRVRDAAEGGLAEGEMCDLSGGWVFDSFYPRCRRITAHAHDHDFDYRMTA